VIGRISRNHGLAPATSAWPPSASATQLASPELDSRPGCQSLPWQVAVPTCAVTVSPEALDGALK
jgi:hypothetical protein